MDMTPARSEPASIADFRLSRIDDLQACLDIATALVSVTIDLVESDTHAADSLLRACLNQHALVDAQMTAIRADLWMVQSHPAYLSAREATHA